MTVYLDTSAFVKLYVEEPGTALVRQRVGQAASVSTSRITYVEARAALARRSRERAFSKAQYSEVVRSLEHEWELYVRLDLTEAIMKLAGDLTERHALRAYDAIQLASALSLRQRMPVEFLTADVRLIAAASKERLVTQSVPV